MHLGDILQAEGVKVLGATSSKKRLFQELSEMAHGCYGLDTATVVEALIERENLGPTGVGHGVALPHARLPLLDKMRGLFVRLDKPLDFDAVDRQPVDLIFALFAPASAGVDHLKALALVSRTMRNPGICAKLRANADPMKLYTILTESPAIQAA
jgi:nitrogen PTS system EIIA component